ncbi:hypothetical protein [Lacibacter sediminis]|uniref:Uncharacterized protein n=1 Tax=Lacibacter sediminis TaxID=2760713 RepID=A0A7G5XK64_9BACT|nr:hypothetical protein [Lacibacter sediminis]QNA45867.1 hypothetical protein H4075_06655 [Lacibacter sediminis]
MKKVHPKKSPVNSASELENNFAETSPQKIVITDECGDALWDAVLQPDKHNLPSKDDQQNNQQVEDLNKLNHGC